MFQIKTESRLNFERCLCEISTMPRQTRSLTTRNQIEFAWLDDWGRGALRTKEDEKRTRKSFESSWSALRSRYAEKTRVDGACERFTRIPTLRCPRGLSGYCALLNGRCKNSTGWVLVWSRPRRVIGLTVSRVVWYDL